MVVKTTINAHTKNYLQEEYLAALIRGMEFPLEYAAQIYSFFADAPIQDIDKFATRYNIPDHTLQRYYRKYIRRVYPNPDLEEMLTHAR